VGHEGGEGGEGGGGGIEGEGAMIGAGGIGGGGGAGGIGRGGGGTLWRRRRHLAEVRVGRGRGRAKATSSAHLVGRGTYRVSRWASPEVWKWIPDSNKFCGVPWRAGVARGGLSKSWGGDEFLLRSRSFVEPEICY